MLVNVGLMLILGSFGYLNGFYYTFVQDFFTQGFRTKALKFGFLLSMFAAFYASVVIKNYLVTIFCLFLEVTFPPSLLDDHGSLFRLRQIPWRLQQHHLFTQEGFCPHHSLFQKGVG